jgi:hypothetical protein
LLSNNLLDEELQNIALIERGQAYPTGGFPAWLQWRRSAIMTILDERGVSDNL